MRPFCPGGGAPLAVLEGEVTWRLLLLLLLLLLSSALKRAASSRHPADPSSA
jgi:hypothetical protein